MQLFHWTRNPSQAAKIAHRKEEIYDSLMNGVQPAEVQGARSFLDTLRNYNVRVTVNKPSSPPLTKHVMCLLWKIIVTTRLQRPHSDLFQQTGVVCQSSCN